MIRNKRGKIISNGVKLEDHERKSLLFFVERGKIIELIPLSLTPGSKTPDLMMDGKYWELKTPVTGSRKTCEHIIQKSAKQSENVIIDIRNMDFTNEGAIELFCSLFKQSRLLKRLMIIDKNSGLLTFCK